MPQMSGLELVQRLRVNPKYSNSPIVLLTARKKRADIMEGYQVGADVYLTKPFGINRLVRNIEVFEKKQGLIGQPKKYKVEQLENRDENGEIIKPVMTEVSAEESIVDKPLQAAVPPQAAITSQAPPPQTMVKSKDPVIPGQKQKGIVNRWEDESIAKENIHLDPFSHAEPVDALRPMHGDNDSGESFQRASGSAAAESNSRSNVRILFADDDVNILQMANNLLGDDFELLEARNGLEAREMAQKYLPDIFIIDGIMPKMTGYQLCGVLHSMPLFQSAPIIFMSEKAKSHDKKYVQTLRVNRFIAKPFKPDDLMDAIYSITSDPNFKIHPTRPSWQEVLQTEEEYVYSERRRHKGKSALSDSRRSLDAIIHNKDKTPPSNLKY